MTHSQLRRELGLPGAVITGLGSIIGTGAFISIGLASAEWGSLVLFAIPLAGLVAVFNGLSSAFLAGRFPVAGGTYEYGYRTLGPGWGFAAGWLFLLAKTASAATAALGLVVILGLTNQRLVALAIVGTFTVLVSAGLRRTTLTNYILVGAAVAGVVVFAVAGLASSPSEVSSAVSSDHNILGAVAFLFVAFTGYGRIATLGEEVKDPERTIRPAVVIALGVSVLVYLAVALGGQLLGGEFWGRDVTLGRGLTGLVPAPVAAIVTVAAAAAMAGVLVNLILGLSRVVLAMARRGDMPRRLSHLNDHAQPIGAVLTAGAMIAGTVLIGQIKSTWSFSAFTVLLYYGVTNLSALKLRPTMATAWFGVASCVFLSFFVPLRIWGLGVLLIALGLLVWQQRRKPKP